MEKARLLFIDNLRIPLIILVITVHLSVTYGGTGGWYYIEGGADTLSFAMLTWHNAASQAFFMGFFFMIAGYFTPASYERKGRWAFLRDRLLRLGIPMVFYDFVINPLVQYTLVKLGARQYDGTLGRFLWRYYSGFHIGTGPLWFVEALLILAVLYTLFQTVAGAVWQRAGSVRRVPNSIEIALFGLFMGVVSFVVRIWFPGGYNFEPLNLQIPFFPQYICMFVVGIVAYHNDWLMRIGDSTGRLWLIIGAIFIVVVFPAVFGPMAVPDADISRLAGGAHWQSLVYCLWEQLVCVAMIVGLSVLFRRRLNRRTRLTKAMCDSVYTVYIIHGPVVVLLAIAIRGIQLYPLAKFGLAALVTVPLCFTLGYLVRRLPLARRIL